MRCSPKSRSSSTFQNFKRLPTLAEVAPPGRHFTKYHVLPSSHYMYRTRNTNTRFRERTVTLYSKSSRINGRYQQLQLVEPLPTHSPEPLSLLYNIRQLLSSGMLRAAKHGRCEWARRSNRPASARDGSRGEYLGRLMRSRVH